MGLCPTRLPSVPKGPECFRINKSHFFEIVFIVIFFFYIQSNSSFLKDDKKLLLEFKLGGDEAFCQIIKNSKK